ncbi:MAG: hypothetical protein GC168_21045 [Candidatus Hydrogenedens sp.]|nr:hypothetical protein [Candidatus Hydrogenedens sp.]
MIDMMVSNNFILQTIQKGAISGLILVVFALPVWGEKADVRYLDNGEARIGIDLSIGGAITHFGRSGEEENLINSHDWGHQVQMSFYSGPTPYAPNGHQPAEHWKQLGWNPIQSGDCYDNRSEVLDFHQDKNALYVKCRPMHWPLNNVPGECIFESWITLDGMTAEVRSKITNQRDDTTLYPARGQELPAVYTNGPYYRLVTYSGDAPFSGEALTTIPQKTDGGFPWTHFLATEHWAALVNDEDWGVGIWSPESVQYVGGFAGKPGKGGPKDAPTGYVSPLNTETLDHNIEYAYAYTLILGSLDSIRAYALSRKPEKTLRWEFDGSRAHWHASGMEEDGWPIGRSWNMQVREPNATLHSPTTFWRAEDVRLLVIEGDFPEETSMRVCFRKHESGQFDEANALTIGADKVDSGRCRIDLRDVAGYEGGMTGLRIDFPGAAPGAAVSLKRVVLYEKDPVAKWNQYYETQRRNRAWHHAIGFHGGMRH